VRHARKKGVTATNRPALVADQMSPRPPILAVAAWIYAAASSSTEASAQAIRQRDAPDVRSRLPDAGARGAAACSPCSPASFADLASSDAASPG
jgi:hypothetical protein